MIIGTMFMSGVIWEYNVLQRNGRVLILNSSTHTGAFGVEEFFAYAHMLILVRDRPSLLAHVCK